MGDDAGSSVLNQLEFMEEMIREAKQERVAVVQTGGDKAIYKYGSGMWSEGGTEAADVTEVKVGRAGDVVDVGGEGESAVEDDTQTLYLRGGGDGGTVNGYGEVMDFL